MDKEIDYLIETDKLEQTKEILKNEILKYVETRKKITDSIVDYRKKYIEENKNDKDKIIDYFDHEAYVNEEAFKTVDKRLKEYNILKESPYFGKIAFSEEDEGIEEFYIGRYGLILEDAYEPIIVDWRSPVASLFYKGTLGEAKYTTIDSDINVNIISRRQFVIKKGELKGLFDSAIDVKDEILQMMLTLNSSDKLKDIVMSIQSEQDKIIRAPENKVVLVNGVAGSGKTTIALHRVSYLLYNFRKKFGDKVIILGPNDIFIDYISQVLPTLGENGINQETLEDYFLSEIGIIDREDIIPFTDYFDKKLSEQEQYKTSKEFIDFLDKKIYELNTEYFNIRNVEFFGKEIVSVNEIKELFTKHYGYMHLFRRSEKIKRILTSKIKDKRDEEVRKLNSKIKEKIKNLSEDEVDIERVNLEFIRRNKIREIVREVINSRKTLESWLSKEDAVSLYKRITNTSTISYLDLAGILYLMIKLEGKKSKNEIKHIVIDEAQDYNMFQFKVLKELTNCTSATIVGDVNQRIVDLSGVPAMKNLDEVFGDNIIEYNLNKSYRSTQQIMEYATKFLEDSSIIPLVRSGEKVFEETVSDDEDLVETIISLIADYEEEGLESIAIITRNKQKLRKLSESLKERIKILTLDNEEKMYTGGKVIIPVNYAKGLEFDGVILVDDFEDCPKFLKYIMCTRALHRLSVIKKEPAIN